MDRRFGPNRLGSDGCSRGCFVGMGDLLLLLALHPIQLQKERGERFIVLDVIVSRGIKVWRTTYLGLWTTRYTRQALVRHSRQHRRGRWQSI